MLLFNIRLVKQVKDIIRFRAGICFHTSTRVKCQHVLREVDPWVDGRTLDVRILSVLYLPNICFYNRYVDQEPSETYIFVFFFSMWVLVLLYSLMI